MTTPNSPASLKLWLAELRQRSKRDDVAAINDLWEAYHLGVMDPQGRRLLRPNPAAARRYEERAAALGHPESITAIADRISARSFRGASRVSAERLYKQAFRAGYPTAAVNLAASYQREGLFRDAVRWYKKAVDGGDVVAEISVARAELYGIGTRRNSKRALSRLHRIARSRITTYPQDFFQCQAMIIIAEAMLTGWTTRRNVRGALRWLERAASLGSDLAKSIRNDYGALI